MEENGKDEGAFDANAFEKKKAEEKAEAQGKTELTADTLTAVVGSQEFKEGETTPITRLDVVSTRWRQGAVHALRELEPKSYAAYREMKYGGGESPDLGTRRQAYQFAAERLLDLTYKRVDPDELTPVHGFAAGWRAQMVTILKIMDPEAHAEYEKLRAKNKGTLAARKAAYVFAVERFLQVTYKLAGF